MSPSNISINSITSKALPQIVQYVHPTVSRRQPRDASCGKYIVALRTIAVVQGLEMPHIKCESSNVVECRVRSFIIMFNNNIPLIYIMANMSSSLSLAVFATGRQARSPPEAWPEGEGQSLV